MYDPEYNAYLDWVLDSNGEPEPFCPFPGEMNSGYCDAAYTYHCTSCPFAKAAWDEYRKEHNYDKIPGIQN